MRTSDTEEMCFHGKSKEQTEEGRGGDASCAKGTVAGARSVPGRCQHEARGR